MKLKCRIKEKEYDIVQGATFSEEYNETLDSGSIILDHISKIKGLKPFDDVYVWNADEEFNGYYNIGDIVNAKEANVDINISEELSLPTSLPEERIGVLNIIPYVNDFKLYGSMIDLWSYFTFEETDSTSRYSLGLILIKVTMINAVTQDEYEGYYYLPYSSVSDTSLVLHLYTADTDNYPYSTNCPSDLTVSYIRQTSTFGSYLVYGSNGFLIIRHTGVFGNDDIYTIKNIEPLSSYTYEEDNSKTEGTLTINGLTQKELLSISGLQLSGLIKGRYITMDLDSVEEESENKVTLIFKTNYYISKNKDNKAFCLVTLESEDSTSWSGTFDAVLKAKVNEAYSPYFDVDDGNTGNYYYYFDTIENNFENVTFERQETSSLPSFFKHLLIDKYEYEMIDLDRNNYKYTLSLMSETKRLEKIVCPNISITQPIAQGVEKRTILYYLQQYLNLYSPKIKKSMGNNKWIYVNKYCLDLRSADCEYDDKDPIGKPLKAIFTDDLYAPEMSLSAPTLREVLSRLMIVKDCIPVVKNDVIYAMKISDTHGEYIVDKEHENFIYGSMDSDSFSTALRKEHQGAISQKNTAHMVEYLGFRNSSSALLTLDNLEVETKFPIYKINKMYLCYYRTVEVTNITTNTTSTKTILVKQDITRLVLQNTVRNTLPADWTKYPSSISKFDEMSQYKLLTVGYDIGSNKIGGWGETYSYVGDLLGWTSITKTYIETMLNLLDYFFPYGVSRKQFLNANEYVSNPGNWIANIVPYRTSNWPVQGGSGDIAAKIKSIFFKIDYNAMYSGTIVHTKDNIDEDDYETTDNNSSSLSILEVDGLYAKEKANRFANPTKSWPTRYKSYEEMNNTYNHVLGSIRYDEDEENDVIVYHREYQIYDGVVLANFVGMRDYVMKNYYILLFVFLIQII